jgi:hypothetical protein
VSVKQSTDIARLFERFNGERFELPEELPDPVVTEKVDWYEMSIHLLRNSTRVPLQGKQRAIELLELESEVVGHTIANEAREMEPWLLLKRGLL